MDEISIILLILLVFLSGCVTSENKPDLEKLKESCISACVNERNKGTNLSNGPCLLNPMSENNDWVCDIAHDPREDVDNLIENQCSAFRDGRATHFIEVTPDCKFIRSG